MFIVEKRKFAVRLQRRARNLLAERAHALLLFVQQSFVFFLLLKVISRRELRRRRGRRKKKKLHRVFRIVGVFHLDNATAALYFPPFPINQACQFVMAIHSLRAITPQPD